jgi:DNA-binding NtrC family response regulator
LKRILLIDDEAALAEIVKLNLEFSGDYSVTLAESGESGLREIERNAFDLVITDFKLPGMSGVDVLHRLKEEHPELPVVLFSVYHDDPRAVPAQARALADGLIGKPIDHEAMDGLVRRILSDSLDDAPPRSL